MEPKTRRSAWVGSRRELLGTGLAGAGALLAVGGCGVGGGAGKSGQDVSSSELEPWTRASVDWKKYSGTTLVFGAQQHPWVQAIKPHLPLFEALTGITVDMQIQGESDFTTKLPVQLGGGSRTPDVFLVPSYPQYVASKWVEPLTGYRNDAKLSDKDFYDGGDLFDSARSFVRWTDGKDYALPITAEVETIFYRKDLATGSLDTFPALGATARDAEREGIAGIAMRGKAESTMAWTCQGFVFAYGGYVIDPRGRPRLDSPESIAAVDFYAKLLQDAGPPGAAGWDWQQVNRAFEARKAAIVIDSSVFGAEYMGSDTSRRASTVRAAPFPSKTGGLRPNMWHWVIGMNRRSAHKKASWLFLQWATSPPTTELLGKEGVSIPRRSVWSSAAFRKVYPSPAAEVVLDTFAKANDKPYRAFYLHPKWPQVGTYFASAMSSVIAGNTSASKALGQAQRRAEKALGK